MRIGLTTTGGKILASTVLVGAAASVAGLGTFGTFTSTTAASAAVASGTVRIALGAGGETNPWPSPSPVWFPATRSASRCSWPTPGTRTSPR